MHHKFPFESDPNDSNSDYPDSAHGYLHMMYGHNDRDLGANSVQGNVTQEENLEPHIFEDEPAAPPPKRAKLMKQKGKAKKKKSICFRKKYR